MDAGDESGGGYARHVVLGIVEAELFGELCHAANHGESLLGRRRLYAERALKGVPEDTIRKLLQDNAADVYGIA